VLQVGSSKKLDPTLNPSCTNVFALNNQDPTVIILCHISVVTEAHKLGLPNMHGTWDPM